MGGSLRYCWSVPSRIITGNFSHMKQDGDMYTELKARGLKFGGFMELWNPMFFVVDLDLIKIITIKDFEYFSDHFTLTSPEEPRLHNNLFALTGEPWRDLRSKLTHSFTTAKIRRLAGTFQSSSKKLVDALNDRLGESESSTVIMRPFLRNVAMDITASTVFGVDTDIFDVENSLFTKMGNEIAHTFHGLGAMIKMTVNVFFPNITKFFKIRLMNPEADKFFSDIVRDVIQKRTQNLERREDFIQLLIEAETSLKNGNSKLEMTEDLLIAQCIIFMLAGLETVGSSLIWAVYELAVNPEIQKKLYEEIKTGIEGNGGEFGYDVVVNEMEYLNQVTQETLRKYPPGGRFDRRVTKNYKVPNSDVVLPKNSAVIIPTHAIQHDPEIYPEPERFLPERFAKQNRHQCAFAAFGLGPRTCIGNRFALAEMKFILANLIFNFEVSPCSETKIATSSVSSDANELDSELPLTIKRREKKLNN